MTPAIEVVDAEAVPAIMPIMAAAFDPRFGEAWTAAQCAGVLAMPGAMLFIARDITATGIATGIGSLATPHGAIGFALTRTVIDETELMLLAVHPAARGHGVGAALLAGSIEQAWARRARHYFLEVRHDNPAIALYSRHGFNPVGRRRNYYRGSDGSLRDAVTFRRSRDG